MPGVLPLIKLNESTRINLFNVTRIDTMPPSETDGGQMRIRVYYTDGVTSQEIVGTDAKRLVDFWDSVGEEVPAATPSAATPTEAQVAAARDRDFSLGDEQQGG